MLPRNYISLVFFLSALLLISAALTNLLIDPRGLYGYSLDQFSNSNYSDRLGDRLNNGSNAQTINELAYDARRFKYNKIFLTRRQDFDCIVFGSSHVNQFSSLPPLKALDYTCDNILNLSFPGTSIEDYLASAYLLLQNKIPDQKLFFSVAPRLLSTQGNNTMLWLKNFKWVLGMNNQLANKITIEDPYLTLGKNLINPAYLQYSLARIFSSIEDSYQIHNPQFVEGHDHTVILRDGSIIYSKKYIAQAARTPVLPLPEITLNLNTSIGESVKSATLARIHIDSNGLLYSKDLFETFKEILILLSESGYDANILLTPIHPAIYFDSPNAILTQSLKQVESKLRSFSALEGISLHGSYNPRAIGCNAQEYYDDTHIMYSCISKIQLVNSDLKLAQ